MLSTIIFLLVFVLIGFAALVFDLYVLLFFNLIDCPIEIKVFLKLAPKRDVVSIQKNLFLEYQSEAVYFNFNFEPGILRTSSVSAALTLSIFLSSSSRCDDLIKKYNSVDYSHIENLTMYESSGSIIQGA
jgi:hypothetical protein